MKQSIANSVTVCNRVRCAGPVTGSDQSGDLVFVFVGRELVKVSRNRCRQLKRWVRVDVANQLNGVEEALRCASAAMGFYVLSAAPDDVVGKFDFCCW